MKKIFNLISLLIQGKKKIVEKKNKTKSLNYQHTQTSKKISTAVMNNLKTESVQFNFYKVQVLCTLCIISIIYIIKPNPN